MPVGGYNTIGQRICCIEHQRGILFVSLLGDGTIAELEGMMGIEPNCLRVSNPTLCGLPGLTPCNALIRLALPMSYIPQAFTARESICPPHCDEKPYQHNGR
jgi:hypothetical protein